MAALITTLVFLVWSAIVAVLACSKAPWFFTAIFGLFELLIFFGVLNAWLRFTRLTVVSGVVRLQSGYFSAGKAREIPCPEVVSVDVKPGMNVGSKVYYDIHIQHGALKNLAVAESICDRRHADWLAGKIREAINKYKMPSA